ncbi:hypothetical protein ISALK_07340 [Isachenkonia alkalipeptolytica]|uniref:Uncharacterized protein n=1 Tax=Isachenkonia alkalipeptolytica TaxID=2565777 RepID=A0AA43XK21_9CLOT|nr:hypothetical protein [Isachenkonia alkalipeptolytica]
MLESCFASLSFGIYIFCSIVTFINVLLSRFSVLLLRFSAPLLRFSAPLLRFSAPLSGLILIRSEIWYS